MKLFSCLSIALLLMAGCQKNNNPVSDPGNVSITITYPQEKQVYKQGDTVFIKASVAYTGELHGYEVKITDSSNGTIVFDDAQHLHNDHFDIDTYWIADKVTKQSTYLFSIQAIVDHDGDQASKKYYIQTIP